MEITLGKKRNRVSWFAFQCGKVIMWRKNKRDLIKALNTEQNNNNLFINIKE